MATSIPRILFVAENVTLSQVVRLAALAQMLERSRYEVHFACSDFDPLVFEKTSFRRWPLTTISRTEAFKKLERGERLYELSTLGRYVDEELELFREIRPDLVISDFRLSLAVSAPLAHVKFAALINAYWSPYAVRDAFPVPDHPIVGWLGVERAARYFPIAMPVVFAHFAAPINSLRKRHGLLPIGSLLEVLSYGDYTLHPDVPELCETHGAPVSHLFLGHIPWAPDAPLAPAVAELLASDARFAYVTLGSSGRVQVLRAVIEALASLGVPTLVATAGRADLSELPASTVVADYVPGDLVARRATFVVTNGGSSTGYQALAAGKPILGIPSNMDQYLATAAVERARAGVSVRAGSLTHDEVVRATRRLLDTAEFFENARTLVSVFARYDCHERFSRFLNHVLERRNMHEAHA